jgi:hypothetical protein
MVTLYKQILVLLLSAFTFAVVAVNVNTATALSMQTEPVANRIIAHLGENHDISSETRNHDDETALGELFHQNNATQDEPQPQVFLSSRVWYGLLFIGICAFVVGLSLILKYRQKRYKFGTKRTRY